MAFALSHFPTGTLSARVGGMEEEKRYAGPERRVAGRAWVEGMLDPVYSLLRWIAAHVRGFYAAVGAFLLIGFALLIVAAIAFAGLAEMVAEGETQRLDEAILLWINGHANRGLDAAALEVTALGGTVVVWIVLLLASAFLWTTHHRYSVLMLWAAYVGGSVINLTLKAIFQRPRPQLFEWRTPSAGHSSFPSGHSMTAVAVFATLAYLIVRLQPTRALRRLTLLLAAVVILLIGLSRLYLGVHYPSDVLGGFVVGFAWATFCALGIEAVRYFRGRRPSAMLEEEGLEDGTAPIRDAVSGEGGG